jgi:GNAT superfamily N-acetyltransferase
VLFTSPLTFLQFVWQLFKHGVFGSKVSLFSDWTFLSSFFIQSGMVASLLLSRHNDEYMKVFCSFLPPGDALLQYPKRPQSFWKSFGQTIVRTLMGMWHGVLCLVTAPIPYVGPLVALGVQFFVFMNVLNLQWAAILIGPWFLATYMFSFSPSTLVYFLVSSKALGMMMYHGNLFERIPNLTDRASAKARHTTEIMLMGMLCNIMMVIPLVGGALFWVCVGLAANVYKSRMSYLFRSNNSVASSSSSSKRPQIATEITRLELATEEAVTVINLAYRSPENFKRSWTGEGHLISGTRVNLKALQATLNDPNNRMYQLRRADDGKLLGSILIENSPQEKCVMLGMFNIDPEFQNYGLGRKLFQYAEKQAHVEFPGSKVFKMWVLEKRQELIDWYVRLGYERTNQYAPFPDPGDGVGRPTERAMKEYGGKFQFVILIKNLF